MNTNNIAVLGLGEIGKPLYDLISTKYKVFGIDIDTKVTNNQFYIMHICYPTQVNNFIDITVDYIRKYDPSLTIINSTVVPGTTRHIYMRTKKLIAHSPIRGKHIKMRDDLHYYTKYIGGINKDASNMAQDHFSSLGLKIKVLSSPEAVELAKLTETTYFGLLIAWAQEVERYCKKYHLDYDEIVSFYEEIKFLPPVKYFPGVIGGHCVMQNIELLRTIYDSDILKAIHSSNEQNKNYK